jgi:hypothetical protein
MARQTRCRGKHYCCRPTSHAPKHSSKRVECRSGWSDCGIRDSAGHLWNNISAHYVCRARSDIKPQFRGARRYRLSHLAHDLGRQVSWDWQPFRDWFPANSFGTFGHLADRLRDIATSVCTTAPNVGVFSPLLVNRATTVTAITSFFDLAGFLYDVRTICEQDLHGLPLIEALQLAIDARFNTEAAPGDFDRVNLYQLLEQCMARVNSSVEGWDERAYENTEWRLFIVTDVVARFVQLRSSPYPSEHDHRRLPGRRDFILRLQFWRLARSR